MWFEILMIPYVAIFILFICFWIVQEGSQWQRHRFLGPVARFIQASPFRAFLIFLIITLLMVPTVLLMLVGMSWDIMDASANGSLSNTVPIVNMLLVIFLSLAAMIPVLWGSFRVWRHSVRFSADARVRTTG